jgi:small subunit ribosomal protein S9
MVENENVNAPLISSEVAANITGGSEAVEAAAVKTDKTDKHDYKFKGPDKTGFYWGTGRRKSSVARVRVKPGSGKLLINKKELGDYFARPEHRNSVVAPLKATDSEGKYDVFVNVTGGGITGQAGAIMLGLSRALRDCDTTLLDTLRHTGFLTRDGRMKERKKYGQRGARRKFQFSKR